MSWLAAGGGVGVGAGRGVDFGVAAGRCVDGGVVVGAGVGASPGIGDGVAVDRLELGLHAGVNARVGSDALAKGAADVDVAGAIQQPAAASADRQDEPGNGALRRRAPIDHVFTHEGPPDVGPQDGAHRANPARFSPRQPGAGISVRSPRWHRRASRHAPTRFPRGNATRH